MASKRGNSNMVKLLLDRGAKIEAKTKVRGCFKGHVGFRDKKLEVSKRCCRPRTA